MKTIVMFMAAVALMCVATAGAQGFPQYDEVQRNGNKMTFFKTVRVKVAEADAPPAAVPTAIAELAVRDGKGEWSEPKDRKTIYKNFSFPLVGTTTIQKNTYLYSEGMWLSAVTEEKQVGDDWAMTFFWVIFPLVCIFLSGIISRLSKKEKNRSRYIERYVLFCTTILIAILCGLVPGNFASLTGTVALILIAFMTLAVVIRMIGSSFFSSLLITIAVIVAAGIAMVMSMEAIVTKTELLRYLVLMSAISSGAYLFAEMIGIAWDHREKSKRKEREADWLMEEYERWQRSLKDPNGYHWYTPGSFE